jgi:hypothetical protein
MSVGIALLGPMLGGAPFDGPAPLFSFLVIGGDTGDDVPEYDVVAASDPDLLGALRELLALAMRRREPEAEIEIYDEGPAFVARIGELWPNLLRVLTEASILADGGSRA